MIVAGKDLGTMGGWNESRAQVAWRRRLHIMPYNTDYVVVTRVRYGAFRGGAVALPRRMKREPPNGNFAACYRHPASTNGGEG